MQAKTCNYRNHTFSTRTMLWSFCQDMLIMISILWVLHISLAIQLQCPRESLCFQGVTNMASQTTSDLEGEDGFGKTCLNSAALNGTSNVSTGKPLHSAGFPDWHSLRWTPNTKKTPTLSILAIQLIAGDTCQCGQHCKGTGTCRHGIQHYKQLAKRNDWIMK